MWQYSNAFTGDPDATHASLFDPEAMVVNYGNITSLVRPGGESKSFDLEVVCTGSDTFEWTATLEPTAPRWLNLQPMG